MELMGLIFEILQKFDFFCNQSSTSIDWVMLRISLCHRPRNCNLSNLCGRCKSLAPEIVSWFLGLCYSRKDFCRAPIDLHS